MSRPLLLCALLVLLVSACSVAGTAGTPVARQGAILATATINSASPQNDAKLMGENVILATQEPTALPTVDAEKVQMLADIKAANERAQQALEALNEQAESIAKSQAEAAASNAETAKANLGTAEYEAKKAAELTEQMRLNNIAKKLEAEILNAQAAVAESNAASLRTLVIFVVCMVAALMGARWMWLHPHVAPVEPTEEESTDDTFGLGPDLLPIPDAPEPCPLTGDMLMHYIDYAMSNAPLGVQNAGAALVGVVDRGSCWAMVNWLDGRKYTTIERVKETNSNYSKKVLSENGRQWCKDEREKYAGPTAPSDE